MRAKRSTSRKSRHATQPPFSDLTPLVSCKPRVAGSVLTNCSSSSSSPSSIGLGVFKLVAQDAQTARSSTQEATEASGLLGQPHSFLSGGATKLGRRNPLQHVVNGLHSRLRHSLSVRIGFEHCECGRQAGISKDLSELREKNHNQSTDLVLIAGYLLTRASYAGALILGRWLSAHWEGSPTVLPRLRSTRAIVRASSRSVLARKPCRW